MKIDRDKIKGLRIEEYSSYIFEFPFKAYRDIFELATLEEVEKRHALAMWNFYSFSISDKYKSDGFLKHYEAYKDLYESWKANYNKKVEPLEKIKAETFTILILADAYPLKECKTLTSWEMLDLLDKCDIGKWAKCAEHHYDTVLNYHRECLDGRKRFNDTAAVEEITRLENIDFNFVGYIINGTSCAGLLHKGMDVAMQLADEMAELAFYKELVMDSTEEHLSNDHFKIDMTYIGKIRELEKYGFFELEKIKELSMVKKAELISSLFGGSAKYARNALRDVLGYTNK